MYRRNGDWRQATALHKAAQHGFMDVIEALVSMGADLHQVAASFPASSCVFLRLAPSCSVWLCSAVCYSVLPMSIRCGNVLQYVAVCWRCRCCPSLLGQS